MLVRKLEMLPVEVIVRGYITGSGWVDYGRTGAVCGHVLPAGLQQCEKLPAPIFTPSTKAALGEHDENIDRARVAETIGAPRAEEGAGRAGARLALGFAGLALMISGLFAHTVTLETGLTTLGAALVATAHILNWRSRTRPCRSAEVGD